MSSAEPIESAKRHSLLGKTEIRRDTWLARLSRGRQARRASSHPTSGLAVSGEMNVVLAAGLQVGLQNFREASFRCAVIENFGRSNWPDRNSRGKVVLIEGWSGGGGAYSVMGEYPTF
jgi:hypothetical protein